jgi:dTDP-4-amino-4,6-dideoxygalactose transaminase
MLFPLILIFELEFGMNQDKIPFNNVFLTENELLNIRDVLIQRHLSGDGFYTKRCHKWLEEVTKCSKALLTHSCTGALEMAAILCDIGPGDEVIMPSYTFVSTANAFVLKGAVPVFVDIREDTLNIDEHLIEEAITDRTKAIVPVHYAGVSCEMSSILEIAKRFELKVIEDAAQGLLSKYRSQPLGSIGDFGALSFHETKNVISGEGGALLVRDQENRSRAEIVREKGTNRSQFFRGEVDKYTWVDVGSSFLPAEIIAAFLWAQFERAEAITKTRREAWEIYHELLGPMEMRGILRRPIVPDHCESNGHMYYVLLDEGIDRQRVLDNLKAEGIYATFHYIPLHSSPAGQKFGKFNSPLLVTDKLSERLIRLPLWAGITPAQQERVVSRLVRHATGEESHDQFVLDQHIFADLSPPTSSLK